MVRGGSVTYRIITLSPLHIGVGSPRGLLDQPTFKLDGKPAIPGSTIKGKVRSLFEAEVRREVERRICAQSPQEVARKMKGLLEDALAEIDKIIGRGLREHFSRIAPDPETEPYAYYPLVCDALSQLHCNPPHSAAEFGDDRSETIRLVASYILLRRSRQRQYCIACTYFGGNGHPSPLIFAPAIAVGEVKTAVAARVSIDRVTGAAKQERLFTVEYVPPYTEFVGHVHKAEELSDYVDEAQVDVFVSCILPALLRRIRTIGKHKSVGFGQVEVKPEGVDCSLPGEDAEKVEEFVRAEVNKRLEEACNTDLSELADALKRVEGVGDKADEIVKVIAEFRREVLKEVR
jgi:CRISPR/Cas system CSM-associated protein Csm3 (group 7 of RAMP superfamily)